jgi:hypothetical protein
MEGSQLSKCGETRRAAKARKVKAEGRQGAAAAACDGGGKVLARTIRLLPGQRRSPFVPPYVTT